jgi:hypothetical protein
MNVAIDTSPEQAQQIIYNYLRANYGLPDAISKIITAQSGHETTGWTSNVYRTDNNCFGYGYTGGGNYYFYNSIEDSVDDVVGWLDRHVPGYEYITDGDDYAAAIRARGYFTDNLSTYQNGIARWYNDNLQLAAGVGVAALVGLGLLLYFVLKK